MKPCPYCGNTEPKMWWDNDQTYEGYNIKCCVVQIYSTRKKEAIGYWDQRWSEISCKQCEKSHDRVRVLQDEAEKLQKELESYKLTEQTAKEEWAKCKTELEAIQEASIITMEELRVSNAVIKQYQDVLSNTQHMLFLERSRLV